MPRSPWRGWHGTAKGSWPREPGSAHEGDRAGEIRLSARPVDVLLAQAVGFHGHLCPGQVLGVRMALAGCRVARDAERVLAREWAAGEADERARQVAAYRVTPESLLLRIEPVAIEPGWLDRDRVRVFCEACGEGVNYRREAAREGRTFCRPCVGERYCVPRPCWRRRAEAALGCAEWPGGSRDTGPGEEDPDPLIGGRMHYEIGAPGGLRRGLPVATLPSVAPSIPRDRTSFWSERKVAWYQRAAARSDYAARVFGAAAELLSDARTALDVGAGFGALALPLARRLERVTALEPAPAMAAALRAAAARQALQNVVVVEAAWGEVDLEPHDLVVCAHVSPLLRRGGPFLAEVSVLARHGVVLVRDAPGGGDKFFFRELYPRLLGRPYEHGCGADESVAELRRLGVEATPTPIEYDSDQPFESLDEACDFWMEYIGLVGAEARAFLTRFLAERLRWEGERWVAPFRKRALVIQWRTGAKESAS